MNRFYKNAKKPPIFRHFEPKWSILDSFAQHGRKGNFFKTALGIFFAFMSSNCKVIQQSYELFNEPINIYNKRAMLGLSNYLVLL